MQEKNMGINDMSEIQQIELVLKDAKRIADIENPAEMVQLAAVSCCPRMIASIKVPTVNAIKAALDKDPFGLEFLLKEHGHLITEELVQYAAAKDGGIILYLPPNYITDDTRMIAIRNKPKMLANMILEGRIVVGSEVSLALVLCGLESDPAVLGFLPPEIKAVLSHAVILRAIMQDSSAIRYIDKPDAIMQQAVVAENPRNILHIASDVVIPELQAVYQEELEKREKSKEKSLKSPSNTVMRHTRVLVGKWEKM
jgi:hypothetical protein